MAIQNAMQEIRHFNRLSGSEATVPASQILLHQIVLFSILTTYNGLKQGTIRIYNTGLTHGKQDSNSHKSSFRIC
jgi:hypothetical protein